MNEDLEAKVAWLEHQLAELDTVVRAAYARIDALETDLRRLREERATDQEGPPDWEVPPHY